MKTSMKVRIILSAVAIAVIAIPVFVGACEVTWLYATIPICLNLFIHLIIQKKCDHRFKYEEVIDWNRDPCCTRCNKYLSVIDPRQRSRFEQINENEYKLIKR
jgi:hypothetical protein